MPRGQRDYGAYAPKEVTASVSDMGEVAARLGSIVTYDKRGDVVDFDNFEQPAFRWQQNVTLPTTYIRFDTDNPRSGSQCVLIHTRNAAAENKYAYRALAILGSKRLGLEGSMANLLSDIIPFLRFEYYTGTQLLKAEFSYSREDKKLYILNSAEGYTEVASNIASAFITGLYYPMKIVVDFDTLKYVRGMFFNHEYDLSAYDIFSEDDATVTYFMQQFGIRNYAASGGDVYFEDIILTQDEP